MPAFIQASDGTVWDAEIQPNPDVRGNESRNSFKWNCYHSRLGQFFQKQIKDAILRAINAVHSRNVYSFDGEFSELQKALYESIGSRITEDPDRKQPFMFKIADILVYYAKDECAIKSLQKNKLFQKSVEYAYKGILKYDSEAFVYDDIRLQKISTYLNKNISALWDDNLTFQRVVNIIVFLMKEDIYYRPRFIQILQDLQKDNRYPDGSEVSLVFAGLCEVVKDFELTDAELANIERWH